MLEGGLIEKKANFCWQLPCIPELYTDADYLRFGYFAGGMSVIYLVYQ